MKLNRIDAEVGLLSVIALLVHIGYTAYAYLAFYYNPTLKLLTAVPFMVLACLHAVLGMSAVFLQGDGTRLDLYPKQNLRTIVQRIAAAADSASQYLQPVAHLRGRRKMVLFRATDDQPAVVLRDGSAAYRSIGDAGDDYPRLDHRPG